MTNQELIGIFLTYPGTHVHLTKLNPMWLEGKDRAIIERMREMYLTNEPINLPSIGGQFKEHIQYIAKSTNLVSTDVHTEKIIFNLEVNYKTNQLRNALVNFNIKQDLPDIITNLNNLTQNAQLSIHRSSEYMSSIAGVVVDEIEQSVKRGEVRMGMPTGWKYLDKYLGGWNKGNVIILAGRPGSGKTAMAMNLSIEASQFGNVLFFSLEMSKEELAKRFLATMGNIHNYKIRNSKVTVDDLERMASVVNRFNGEFHVDDDATMTIYDLVGKARLHKAKHGLNLVVIDYMQLLKGTKQNREQEVAEISRQLKIMAKELGVTVIALAQLSRKSEERADKRPLLSDLRESGAIEQDADVVMFPFRPAYYEEEKPEIEMDAELIIRKNRHGECATIPCTFEGQYTRYREMI
jgi:replicative DNA helicase